MQLPWKSGLLAALLAVGLVSLAVTPAETADDKKPTDKAESNKVPFIGNWKLTVLFGAMEDTSFIVKIEDKDGKPDMGLVWAPEEIKGQTTLENLKIDAKGVHFDVKLGGQVFHMNAYAPKGDKEPKVLLGSAKIRTQLLALQLEKTDAVSLKDDETRKTTAGGGEFQKAAANSDYKEKREALKEILHKHDGKPVALLASADLLKSAAKHAEKEEEIATAAEQYAKTAAIYGPELESQAALLAARDLLTSDKGSGLALAYAQKAQKALPTDATPAQAVPVLKTVVKVLHKAKKDDEAKALETRIAKLDEELDKEFEKDAIPFKPEPFKGRKASSHRVALVELFTGAQCPPCVAADVAFDAAAQTFKPKEAVFLEYHLHIPGPDRLTNADTEARAEFYNVRSTPTLFINGKITPGLGGPKAKTDDGKYGGEKSYEKLRPLIEAALETEATAEMQLKVDRKGDKVELEARVFELKKPDEKLRLHVVLVEEVVRYPGGNGQRLHHDVVRAFIGGTEGAELKEATLKKNVTIDLAEVAKTQLAYMEDFEKKGSFLEDELALDLKHLKVVVFIQDNASKEVLQAAQIEVSAAK